MRSLHGLWLVAVLACGAPAHPTSSPPQAWDPVAYRTAIDDALALRFSLDPVGATSLGEHRYDDQWPDLSKAGIEKARTAFHASAEQLRALAAKVPATVSGGERDAAGTDHPALDARLLANRFEGFVEYSLALRGTEKVPSGAIGLIGNGVDRILAHPYAPLATRMTSLAARLEKVPALLDTVRPQLDHPRRASLEVMALTAKSTASMLRGIHPDAAELGGDAALAARVATAANTAAAAIEAYAADVAKSWPVEQAAEQPITIEQWERISRLNEGVTMTSAQIKQMAEAELARLQGELDKLVATAGKPGETREAFLKRMAEEQPAPEAVLDAYRASHDRVAAWLKTSNFVTVPWKAVDIQITLPPPMLRAISFASLNMAGALDPITDARFEVNAPTPDLPPQQQQTLRAFHARGALDLVSTHEGLPGHYLQNLVERDAPSNVRRLILVFNLSEGWAHYCEQAVLDAGYAADPMPERAQAYMLRLALQRAVRAIVDVGEADGSLTLDAAAQRLEKEGMLGPEGAKMEARRGMINPVNMFAYMYGKLAIQKLRDEVRAKEGAAFSLQSFHDRLLKFGQAPVADIGEIEFGIPRQ